MHITRNIFLCLACVANMALPADAMSDHVLDNENRQLHTSTSEGYRLRFALTGASALTLAVTRSDGTPANDAQVVITLIDGQGRQYPVRAVAAEDGYRIEPLPLAAPLCEVEAEVITGGELLTDHFHIHRAV